MYLKTEGAAEVLVELFQDNRDVLDDLYVAAFFWGCTSGFSQPTLSCFVSLALTHSHVRTPSLYFSMYPGLFSQ